MIVAYFVHNIGDAAVLKRISMLGQGGADVRLIGFSRFKEERNEPERGSAIVIGRSSDGKFLQRVLVILRCLLWPFDLIKIVKASDAILCRNLEMLALGYAIKILARSKAPLTYECLDIHKKLLGASASARWLRRFESFLMSQCQTVITSSPGFIRNYFHGIQNYKGSISLVENKVLGAQKDSEKVGTLEGPEWVIGWFGIIRCRKSLMILDNLTRILPGLRVIISGRVAYQEFEDFDATVRANPNITYTGPFQPRDLPEVYGQSHFVWAIDYYEEGDNSTWLLPNRLYDSLAFGAIPIALKAVETGHWLEARKAGIVVDAPLDELPAFFRRLTQENYLTFNEATKAVPFTDIFHDKNSVAALIGAIS